MANFPIEKKRGGASWIGWVLGLLLLAGAIWLLAEVIDMGGDDVAVTEAVPEAVEEPGVAASPGMQAEPGTQAAGEAITSLDAILDAEDPQQLVGRPVRLSGVTAKPVAGDSTYWIYNPDEGVRQRVFTVLYSLGESEHGPGTGADGTYDVDEGANMQVDGRLMAVGPNDPDQWGVTGDEEREIREYQVYIRARDLENLDHANITENR